MVIGAQLYTVREYMRDAEGLDAALAKIAAIGYKYAQLSGAGPIDPKTARAIFDKHGVGIVVTHTSPDRIRDDTAAVIEDHKIYGARYIGIGMMPEKYHCGAEGVKDFIRDYLPAARMIKNAGMVLTYHNHALEFEKINGRLRMDYILEGFAPDELQILPDVYWLQYAGCDPAQWLRDNAGRYDLIHYKDMLTQDGRHLMMAVMEGNMNWGAITEASESSGAKYAFVEQDDCNGLDPFECLAASYKNLTGPR